MYCTNINQEANQSNPSLLNKVLISFVLLDVSCYYLLLLRSTFIQRHHYVFIILSTCLCLFVPVFSLSVLLSVSASILFVCSLLRRSHLALPAGPTELCCNLELKLCQIHGERTPEPPLSQRRFQSSAICSILHLKIFLLVYNQAQLFNLWMGVMRAVVLFYKQPDRFLTGSSFMLVLKLK